MAPGNLGFDVRGNSDVLTLETSACSPVILGSVYILGSYTYIGLCSCPLTNHALLHPLDVVMVPWVGQQHRHRVRRVLQVIKGLEQRYHTQDLLHTTLALQQHHCEHIAGSPGHADDVRAEGVSRKLGQHPAWCIRSEATMLAQTGTVSSPPERECPRHTHCHASTRDILGMGRVGNSKAYSVHIHRRQTLATGES